MKYQYDCLPGTGIFCIRTSLLHEPFFYAVVDLFDKDKFDHIDHNCAPDLGVYSSCVPIDLT